MATTSETKSPTPAGTVRGSDGKVTVVQGAGALKDSPFRIKASVDLTKPIAAQVLKDKRKRSA